MHSFVLRSSAIIIAVVCGAAAIACSAPGDSKADNGAGNPPPATPAPVGTDAPPTPPPSTTASCATEKFALAAAHKYDTGLEPQQGNHVVVGDLNKDGKPDLVTSGSGDLLAFLNKGDGTFAATPVKSKGAAFARFALADVTGDGALDVVTPDRMFPGNGDGTFGLQINLKGTLPYTGDANTQVVAVDVNGDKALDLLLTNGHIAVLLNAGSGELASPVEYGNNFDNRVAIGDFNGDGKPDLAGVSNDSRFQNFEIIMSTGGGAFAKEGTKYQVSTAGSNGSTRAIAVGDFNADGKPDVAILASPDNYESAVDIFINKGDGTFDANKVKSFPISKLAGSELLAADLNGDGKMDLVAGLGGVGLGRVAVLMGKGDGTFEPVRESATQAGPLNIVAADFRANGLLGIATIDNGYSDTDYKNPINVLLPTCQ